MKILFFIGHLNSGGAERVVSLLSNKLFDKGFDIEILTYYDRKINYSINNNIKITKVVLETKSSNIIKNMSWLKKYFNNNADLIISFLAPFNMLALLTKGNTPIIVADRNDPNKIPNNKLLRLLRNKIYKKANYVVVQTNNNKNYFNYLNNVIVINNPINIGNNVGKAINTQKENKIVSVARLMPQKNQLLLIEVFNEVLKEHKDYKLIIYGEGPERSNLENKINELKLNDSVLLPGNDNDVINKILDAKVFVLPSNYEGMPNSLIEAMCIGLPVISTKVSGANELIKDKENGLLILSNLQQFYLY